MHRLRAHAVWKAMTNGNQTLRRYRRRRDGRCRLVSIYTRHHVAWGPAPVASGCYPEAWSSSAALWLLLEKTATAAAVTTCLSH